MFNTSIHKSEKRWGEILIQVWLWFCAGISLITTVAIIALLIA